MTPATDAAAASFAALTHKLDYLDEADIRRVRDAYLARAESQPQRFVRLDASQPLATRASLAPFALPIP